MAVEIQGEEGVFLSGLTTRACLEKIPHGACGCPQYNDRHAVLALITPIALVTSHLRKTDLSSCP